jgi:hypothetical protein
VKFRTKVIILTIVTVLIFLLLQVLDLSRVIATNTELFKALIVSAVFLIGLYWAIGFKVQGSRFVTILGYSTYLVFIQSLFLELIVFQNVGRISEKTASFAILVVFAFSIYFLTLTVNILNLSYLSNIPLAKAAKAANFVYTLFGAYFSFLLIFRAGLDTWVRLAVFLFVIILLTFSIFWFKQESKKQLLGETIVVVLTMFTFALIFMIWPFPVEVATMFYTIIFYILIGLGLEERDTTSKVMRAEYIVLIIIAVLLVLKLASWGINGTLI